MFFNHFIKSFIEWKLSVIIVRELDILQEIVKMKQKARKEEAIEVAEDSKITAIIFLMMEDINKFKIIMMRALANTKKN